MKINKKIASLVKLRRAGVSVVNFLFAGLLYKDLKVYQLS